MPASQRAELTAEIGVIGPDAPGDPLEAARSAAGESGLAREAGPARILLAGERRVVLETLTKVVDAALDAGAEGADLEIKVQKDAPRFD